MRHCALLIALIAVALPLRAHAAVHCDLPATTLDFGALAAPTSQTDRSAELIVNCSGGPANKLRDLCVSIGAGDGSARSRRMTAGDDVLQYQIYADPMRTIAWGDDSAQDFAGLPVEIGFDDEGKGTLALSLYGRIPRQTVANGFYRSAELTATVTTGNAARTSCGSNTGASVGTAKLDVRALVGAGCSLDTDGLTFSADKTASDAIRADGALMVNCPNGVPYTVALNAGSAADEAIFDRSTAAGGEGSGAIVARLRLVGPQIARDNDSATILRGYGKPGVVFSATGNGDALTVPVHGPASPLSDSTHAGKPDTVVLTVTF